MNGANLDIDALQLVVRNEGDVLEGFGWRDGDAETCDEEDVVGLGGDDNGVVFGRVECLCECFCGVDARVPAADDYDVLLVV